MERQLEVYRLSGLCKTKIGPDEEIYALAKDFLKKVKLSSKDAVHLACAYHSKSNFFLTCDADLVKRAKRLNLTMKIMNPVEYIREVKK